VRILKTIVKRTPIIGPLALQLVLWRERRRKKKPFNILENYPGVVGFWEKRYSVGNTSGLGSYGELADYKAEIVNGFVVKYQVQSVIEFGCGDGNQLSLAQYPAYIGVDVSRTVIKQCINKFKDDLTKSFFVYVPDGFVDRHAIFKADMALSMEVIFHLTEDDVYEAYLRHLFASAKRYVIIFSSNVGPGHNLPEAAHVKHRCFTDWVEVNEPNWTLIQKIDNRYPFDKTKPVRSYSDFYIYEQKQQVTVKDNH
jgi:SAM-dependent methyltransferase